MEKSSKSAAELVEFVAVHLHDTSQTLELGRACAALHRDPLGLASLPCVDSLALELILAVTRHGQMDRSLFARLPSLALLFGLDDEDDEDVLVHPFVALACDLLLAFPEECETALGVADLLVLAPNGNPCLLGAALRTLTSTTARVEQLVAVGLTGRVVTNLQTWPPSLSVNMANLLVLTLVRSVHVNSRSLLAEFESSDGYSALASTAVWLDKAADNGDKIAFVQVLRRMLFVGGTKQRSAAGIASNPKAFRVLLWVMAEVRSDALTAACWHLVEEIVQTSYVQLQEIEPFRLMVEHFDALSLDHRLLILRTLRHTLKSSNLLLTELRAIVGMVQSTCPSTVLLVCDFFRSLLSDKVVHSRTLLPSNIVHVLLQMLVPGEQLPCASVLAMSSSEQQLCLSVRSEQDLERQRAVSDPVSVVLECILRRVLALIWELIASDLDAFAAFQQEGGTKRLVSLASTSMPLRPDVFIVLVGVVSCDPSALRVELIPKLVEMLRDAGGTASVDSSSLTLRTQVLDTLTSIFDVDPDSRVLFREQGGFTWILAVLAGIGSAIKEQPEQELDRPFQFVVRLLDMLSACLTNCPSNQDHLRNVVGISTLSDVLLSTGFFGNNRFLYQLVQSLLRVAVETSWPPQQPDHVVIMRNPEIVYVVVVLMVHHQRIIDGVVLERVFAELNLLVERSTELHLLCSKRLLGILLSHYVARLGELADPVQRQLLSLVQRLASYHMSPGEVKQLLQIMPSLSPRVFSDVCQVLSSNQVRPKESLCFSWNSSAFLDFGPLPAVEWPFSAGFSVSFWIRIAGRRSTGDASIHVVSFSPGSPAHPFFLAVTVSDDGRVCLWSSTTESFVFSTGDPLALSQWNHVVVSHAPANSQQRKKRQIGLCRLHVNGVLRGVGSLAYGPIFSGSDLQVHARFGDQNPGSSLWFLGQLAVFRDVVLDESALALCKLGPSSLSFSDVKLHIWALLTSTGFLVYPTQQSGNAASSSSTVASPAKLAGATDVVLASPVAQFAVRSLSVVVRPHAPLCLSLASVGGVGALLHLVRCTCLNDSSVALASALWLLGSVLVSNPSNMLDMVRCNGWDVLRFMLGTAPCACEKNVLEAVRRLPNPAPFLDWQVWHRGSGPFQVLYFETLAMDAEVLQLSPVDLLALFDVFETSPPSPLAEAVPVLFRSVLEPLMPVSDSTVRALTDFVLVLNDRPESGGVGAPAACSVHAARPLHQQASVRPSMSPQSLRKRHAGGGAAASTELAWRVFQSRRAAQQCCLQRLVEIAREKPSLVLQQLPEQFLVFLMKDLPIDPCFQLLRLHQPLSGNSWKLLLACAVQMGASETSVSVLLEMMTGSSDSFSLTKGSIVQMQALLVLLRSLAGCFVSPTLARSTVQRLHDAFLHNAVIRKQILSTPAVSSDLCRLIASAVLHSEAADDDYERLTISSCSFLREILLRLILELPNDSAVLLNSVRDLAMAPAKQGPHFDLAPPLVGIVLGHVLGGLVEVFCQDKAMPMPSLVLFSTLVVESWTVFRNFALVSVDNPSWDERMLVGLLRLATRIVDDKNGGPFLSCVGRCCAHMISSKSESVRKLVVRVLLANFPVLALLCGLPDARIRLIGAIGAVENISPDLMRLLREGLQVSVEEAKRVAKEMDEAEDQEWAAKWIADLQKFQELQSSLANTPQKSEVSLAASNMPAALMERQLVLQKPVMVSVQQRALQEARALESWKKLEKSLTHERGTWPTIEVRGRVCDVCDVCVFFWFLLMGIRNLM